LLHISFKNISEPFLICTVFPRNWIFNLKTICQKMNAILWNICSIASVTENKWQKHQKLVKN
jgi:hypothetical protein